MNKFDTEKITKAFEYGDSTGLDEIQKQITDNNITGEVQELLTCVYKLNYILIETEQESYASKYNGAVQDIYSEMKVDLFEMLGIKE